MEDWNELIRTKLVSLFSVGESQQTWQTDLQRKWENSIPY